MQFRIIDNENKKTVCNDTFIINYQLKKHEQEKILKHPSGAGRACIGLKAKFRFAFPQGMCLVFMCSAAKDATPSRTHSKQDCKDLKTERNYI
jgi:hypothetical protein